MRLRYLSALALVTACGSHIRRDVIGSGIGAVQTRGAVAVTPPAGGMTLAPGNYELALRFDVPRAQIVEWTVSCPGVDRHGSLGETFEAYRERRLAQLRADRERERRNTAAVTGAIIGAVAPDVHAQGQASGPNGNAQVDATVSGQAVGAAAGTAIADATVSDIVELAPGDVGAGRLATKIHLALAQPGACAVTALADDPNVIAGYDVIHVRDLRAEARARDVAANQSAHQVRGELTAQLVAYGADTTLRQRQLEAEARARAEAEARARAQAQLRLEAEARARAEHQAKLDAEAHIRAEAEAQARAKLKLEADARLQIELRLKQEALRTRGELYAYLTGTCGADPNHRQRLREEREARLRIERQEYEARLRIDYEARMRAEREREARLRIEREQRDARERAERDRREARERAERERRMAIEAERARRVQLALEVRADLAAYLVSLGARERPPMPAPLPENPGSPPFADAEWIAGTWRWTGGRWIWEAGGWRDTTVFGVAGSVGGAVSGAIGGTISVSTDSTPTYDEPVRTTTTTVRDHRSETVTVQPQAPAVRDHRSGTVTVQPQAPAVRDHRSERPSEAKTPAVRDHRKDDDDKKSDGPRVRDHRR